MMVSGIGPLPPPPQTPRAPPNGPGAAPPSAYVLGVGSSLGYMPHSPKLGGWREQNLADFVITTTVALGLLAMTMDLGE